MNGKSVISALLCFCLLAGLIGQLTPPAAAAQALQPALAEQDGGLILTDEMADFSQAYATHHIGVGSVTESVYTQLEGDFTYWRSSGSDPYVVYRKKDIRSMHLVLYAAPDAELPELELLRSEDGTAYSAVAAETWDEGSRNGSWRRIVYSATGLASTDYLKLAWQNTANAVLTKVRIGYTGGAALEDTGFEQSVTADLEGAGVWETRYAKSAASEQPDFSLTIESAGGAPGQFAQVRQAHVSASGIVFWGQRVRLPDFFDGPDDLSLTLDYQLHVANGSPGGQLKLVAFTETVWDELAADGSSAQLYDAGDELHSTVLHGGSSANITEWTGLKGPGASLASSLTGYAGKTIVLALLFQTFPGAQSSVLRLDNVELNTGELSNSRPHFIRVKDVRDKLFAFRWAADVLEQYKNRYEVWLEREIELIPDSTYIWDGRFIDPELDVSLVFEYKSYSDILAAGYDYDTFYQIAEFRSPGMDPESPADDRIVSLANTSSEAMERITKGWYAKWTQFHAEAAQYLAYLYVLTGDAVYAAKAAEIVKEFAAKYPSYVLHDVVSPVRDFATRAFYQPLNESQHLITPMVYAVDAIYDSGELDADHKKAIRDDLLVPAAEAVKRGARLSNFQVIQNTGIGLVGYLYDDPVLINEAKSGYFATAQAVDSLGSFPGLLDFGVGEDGFWFEGTPSYHSFVLKFFIYLADAAQRFGSNKGEDLYTGNAKLKSMFDAILQLPYPDLTLQANNDSPYKLNLLTPIYFWMMETADRQYGQETEGYRQFLNQAYASVSRSSADMYSLLFGPGHIPPASGPVQLKDVNMAGLGTVFTRSGREGQTYMTTLDYGPHQGLHDHFDKLNVTTYGNGRVWLDDLGISPYGTESADHYYSYSVAHNTVTIPNRSQAGIGGSFLALGRTGSMHASAAAAEGVLPDVQRYRRGLVLVDDWMLDIFSIKTTRALEMDWMAHVPDSTQVTTIPVSSRSGALGTDFGYQHIQLEAAGQATGDWGVTYTDTGNPAKRYRVEMLDQVTTDVYLANGFGTGNAPSQRIPVLAARRTIDGEGTFTALHRFNPDADGIATVSTLDNGVRLGLIDGRSIDLYVVLDQAAEDTSFKLVERDSNNSWSKLEIVNDNRLAVGPAVYVKSDQVLSGLSIARSVPGTVVIDNDPEDGAPFVMTALSIKVGPDFVGTVTVDDVSVPFVLEDGYVKVNAPLKVRSAARNPSVTLYASEDTYAKESEPTRILGEYSTMGARHGGTTRNNMAAYMKFDLDTYRGADASEAKLRFFAYDNTAPFNPVELEVYGILDNDWSESELHWDNAPNIAKANGYAAITGIGTTAFHLGTVSLENNNRTWHEVDVTDFIREHGTGSRQLSFVVFPKSGYGDWIFIYSKESGSRAPQLVLKESREQKASASGYVRGGQYANQTLDGTAHMEVKDSADPDQDRIAYVKFDAGHDAVGKGLFRFHVSGIEPGRVIPLSIYGLTDTSWTEASLSWNTSPNHAAADTDVTGVPNSAAKIATIFIDGSGSYTVDATSYLQTRTGLSASFLIADESDTDSLVTIAGRLSAQAPELLTYRPHRQIIDKSAYIWGGTQAGSNFGTSTHLVVKNGPGTTADRKSYLQIELSKVKTKRVNLAMLQLRGSNTTSSAAVPVAVYGLLDNDWSEDAITFLNAPNHDPADGAVTGIGTTAFHLDTVEVGPVGTYSWDISDFLYASLQRGGYASLMLVVPEVRNDGYIDFNSDDGATKPVLHLEY